MEQDHTHLVARLKEFQRQRPESKHAWHRFVQQRGTSNFDPNRHATDTLLAFLSRIGWMAARGAGDRS